MDDFEDVCLPERGFRMREPMKPRDCKIQVEKTVREPDRFHPKIQSLLYESRDSSLQPPDPGSLIRRLQPEDYELQTNPIGLPADKPPCYLPQEDDDHVIVPAAQSQMMSIGPYATGRVDWSPLAGLTGTRPVVDSYSITRFSTNEWRRRNYDTLQAASNAIEKSVV
jgi:tektin-4